jgi:hypothetical protein
LSRTPALSRRSKSTQDPMTLTAPRTEQD